MLQAVEQVETLDSPTFVMIIMPTHHLVLVRVRLFLDGIVDIKTASSRSTFRTVVLTSSHESFEVYSPPDK